MKALILSAVAIMTIAQGQEPAEPATFQTGVANVRVDAQVYDGTRAVVGLTKADFLIYDNNVAQAISYFQQEREPVTLLLVLDVSGSMSRHLEELAAASRTALKGLRPGDQVGVMAFARNTKLMMPFTSDLTRVTDELKAAVNEKELGSGTQINLALKEAAKVFSEQGPAAGRRAVLIVTDNLGVNYQMPNETVVRALHDANAVCNSIVVGKSKKGMNESRFKNPDFTYADVFAIADETGGEAIKSDKTGEAFGDILERIRLRYSLHYGAPESAAGKYHEIRVELTAMARARYPKAIVRHRNGYYAR